jgi:hypothetical protein
MLIKGANDDPQTPASTRRVFYTGLKGMLGDR